jgi:predicted nucleic-acid-binding protein
MKLQYFLIFILVILSCTSKHAKNGMAKQLDIKFKNLILKTAIVENKVKYSSVSCIIPKDYRFHHIKFTVYTPKKDKLLYSVFYNPPKTSLTWHGIINNKLEINSFSKYLILLEFYNNRGVKEYYTEQIIKTELFLIKKEIGYVAYLDKIDESINSFIENSFTNYTIIVGSNVFGLKELIEALSIDKRKKNQQVKKTINTFLNNKQLKGLSKTFFIYNFFNFQKPKFDSKYSLFIQPLTIDGKLAEKRNIIKFNKNAMKLIKGKIVGKFADKLLVRAIGIQDPKRGKWLKIDYKLIIGISIKDRSILKLIK